MSIYDFLIVTNSNFGYILQFWSYSDLLVKKPTLGHTRLI